MYTYLIKTITMHVYISMKEHKLLQAVKLLTVMLKAFVSNLGRDTEILRSSGSTHYLHGDMQEKHLK